MVNDMTNPLGNTYKTNIRWDVVRNVVDWDILYSEDPPLQSHIYGTRDVFINAKDTRCILPRYRYALSAESSTRLDQ